MGENKKEALINRVCPLCRVYGKNIRLFDAKEIKSEVNITIATCMACQGVYHFRNDEN